MAEAPAPIFAGCLHCSARDHHASCGFARRTGIILLFLNAIVTSAGIPAPTWRRIVRGYRRGFGLTPLHLDAEGRSVHPADDPLADITSVIQARRHAIAESVRWGEPYVFLVADDILSWAVALVDGETLKGGVCGGEVVSADNPLDVTAANSHLAGAGLSRPVVLRHLRALPVWPQARVRAAAEALYESVYATLGWKPALLLRNRTDATQQRQIAEAIHQGKETTRSAWPFAAEQRLLLLIRAGDHNGVRKHLNILLAGMFLDSPRLPVLQARVLELLGYLIRVAIEDAPSLAPLMEAHQGWIVRIIGAHSFDELCRTVRDALDAFMLQVAQHGLTSTNLHVRRALDHIARNPTRAVTLDEAAQVAGISRFRLAHLIKATTGQTLLQHGHRVRIAEACRLLESTSRTCADIAASLGFADQSHLTRTFRHVAGITPARYRRDRHGTDARAPHTGA